MKKLYSITLALVMALSLFVGVASADHTNHTLEVVEARSDAGGVVVIILRFGGDWDKSELKSLKNGNVFLGDEKYGLSCKVEGDLVYCTTSRQVEAQNITISLGGFTLYTFVRPTGGGAVGSEAACYTVFNIGKNTSGIFWNPLTTHCPDSIPSEGDIYNSGSFGYFEFDTDNIKSCNFINSVGIGYYRTCI